MKIYGITIKPTSPFGTPLKGDTLFGHFCWQAVEDPELLPEGLDSRIADYGIKPFAVFSSAWPVIQRKGETLYALPRPFGFAPALSERMSRKERIQYNKAAKKKKWLLTDSSMKIELRDEKMQTDEELFDLFLKTQPAENAKPLRLLPRGQKKLCIPVTQPHNSINRLTMTTGSGEFAPFSLENFQFLPELRLIIFTAVDQEVLGPEQLQKAFERIGCWGFGRDASTGLGRFSVESVQEQQWPQATDSDTACFTLGPTVPAKKTFVRCHAAPFTRFGRHGSALARSANPFKKPVIMADEGAILFPADREVFTKPYIGTAVQNVSVVDERTVVQGYSLYLPC